MVVKHERRNRKRIGVQRATFSKLHMVRKRSVRPPNSDKNIANVANMVVDCMEVNTEEACLNALFNSDYFWNK